MYKAKRLHPISMLVKLGKNIKDAILPLAILLFSSFKQNHWLSLISVAAMLLFICAVTILSWFKHTYELDEKELRIEYGVFIRKKRYIPYERIQSINISEGILQRIFGLVKVQVETAGGKLEKEAEAELSAVSRKEAQYIQEFYITAKKSSSPALEAEERQKVRPAYKITAAQLVLLSLTSGGVGVVISAVLAFLSQLDDYIPYQKIFGHAEKLVANSILSIAIMVFLGFLLLWIIAFIGMLLKYANFTVSKTEDDLIVTHGLLERRQLTIPLNRIQGIQVSENILRQILGVATVYIESAGGSLGNKEGAKVMVIPLMKREQIPAVIHPLLPDYHISFSFRPLPKRAAVRYIFRSWYLVVPIVLAALIFLKLWGLLGVILFAAAAPWALLKYKDAGWNLENLQLSFRFRRINRITLYMKKNRIQSIEMKESYFQGRKGLGTIETFVKSGIGTAGGKIIDVSQEDMREIYQWYMAKKENDPEE